MTENDLRRFRQLPLVRNSERASFKTCQAQWNWRWNMGLVPAMPRQDARWFGSAWHIVMAEYYLPKDSTSGFGRTNVEELHSIWDQQMKGIYTTIAVGPYFGEDSEREWVDACALGHLMIDGYVEYWKGDPGWEILMPEQRFRARVPFNMRQAKRPATYWQMIGLDGRGYVAEIVGTFDMPIRDHSDNGRIKIVDHKTAAQYDPVLSYLVKDDQAGTYIAVGTQALREAELIGKDEAITGMIFNFARKAKPDERAKDEQGRYLNQNGTVSKRQPLPLFYRESVERNKANRLRQMARIADDAEQIQLIREGQMGITKNPGRQCSWCDYRDLCDIDENGGDTEQFIKDVFKYDDPYKDHRKEME